MMRYLLDEVEAEADYTEKYSKAEEQARQELEAYRKKNEKEEKYPRKYYWDFMPSNMTREPNNSITRSRIRWLENWL